tara:strand:+ start:1485 stop:2045 length:561 start_codon:yes stop_codon:yes gene_type:complete
MSLHLIIGPMYSGKTTELLRLFNRYNCIGKNIVVITHSIDTRYHKGICSHDARSCGSICLSALTDLEDDIFTQADVIFVEELQFFEDAFKTITYWVDRYDKTVICAGLDGDFERNPFGDVLKLIPHADTITKLTALCKKCNNGTPAIFSKRVSTEYEQTLVGGSESYQSVCRKHYLEEKNISTVSI